MILVIGSSGQLAQELKYTCPYDTYHFLGRKEINLFDNASLKKTIERINPQTIINTSAYTHVDHAEKNLDLAYSLNKDVVKNLAEICKTSNIRFIHISTDYVFNGKKNSPYLVTDSKDPLNVYGRSKSEGEDEVVRVMDENYSIIRTSWLYSSYSNNFVKTMIDLMNNKNELYVVSDEISCPTYARGLSEYIWSQTKSDKLIPVCHWTDLGQASWYEFAEEIYKKASIIGLVNNNNLKLKKIKANDYNAKAIRPKYSRLEVNKTDKFDWRINLNTMLMELKENSTIYDNI